MLRCQRRRRRRRCRPAVYDVITTNAQDRIRRQGNGATDRRLRWAATIGSGWVTSRSAWRSVTQVCLFPIRSGNALILTSQPFAIQGAGFIVYRIRPVPKASKTQWYRRTTLLGLAPACRGYQNGPGDGWSCRARPAGAETRELSPPNRSVRMAFVICSIRSTCSGGLSHEDIIGHSHSAVRALCRRRLIARQLCRQRDRNTYDLQSRVDHRRFRVAVAPSTSMAGMMRCRSAAGLRPCFAAPRPCCTAGRCYSTRPCSTVLEPPKTRP